MKAPRTNYRMTTPQTLRARHQRELRDAQELAAWELSEQKHTEEEAASEAQLDRYLSRLEAASARLM